MRYKFSDHPTKEDWYRVKDLKTGLTLDFEAHEYSDNQIIADMGNIPIDPKIIETELQRIGDWVKWHHYSEAFMPEKFIVQFSEDDSTIQVIRQKDPEITIAFPRSLDRVQAASVVRKASMYLKMYAPDWDNVDF